MKTCFGYIRVSTVKQGDGVSLDAQKEAITGFASQNNLTIIRWFEEKQTAAKSGRPIFNEMLKLLRRGVASGMVVHKIDRSARNLKDWAIVSELPDAGIDVYIASETLDFTSRGGRLSADIQAVIAADFIRNLREETIKGLRGRLKQGLYPFRAPIGYLDNGRGNPKTPDPIKAPLITAMFESYASGQHSLRSLEIEMQKQGLRNFGNRPVSLHGIETILRNPFYTGIIEIKRTGAVYQGIHEPLITADIFQRVQEVKAGRAGKKVTRHNHLFRGLFRCGLCDGPMSPERQKGHVYYRCQLPTCPTKTIREEVLEQTVITELQGLELNDSDARAVEQEWQKQSQQSDADGVQRSLKLRIKEHDGRLNRLTDLLIDQVIDTDTFHRRKKTHVGDCSPERRSSENCKFGRNQGHAGKISRTDEKPDRALYSGKTRSETGYA